MTSFEIQELEFTKPAVDAWAVVHPRNANWPVVYILNGEHHRGIRVPIGNVYVGETVNAPSRLSTHVQKRQRQRLETIRVVLDDSFNKSVCLDLEAHLIRWFSGDGQYQVLNLNPGIPNADYFDRPRYRDSFREVFDSMRDAGLFRRTIPEIENSDLFKFSPFKTLNDDQAATIEGLVEGLLNDLEARTTSSFVIRGGPGTGKTVIAIFLMKLLADIGQYRDGDDVERDLRFSEFFVPDNRELLKDLKVGLVVPQKSLRKTIKRVFATTPNLSPKMVFTPYQVGIKGEKQGDWEAPHFDLLIVDEAHRLVRRGVLPAPMLYKQFDRINQFLFDDDHQERTQLDWIKAQSKHAVLLVDEGQTVRPADVPAATLQAEVRRAQGTERYFELASQMRVHAGEDYLEFVRELLAGNGQDRVPDFGDYDLRLFDDLGQMYRQILARNQEDGLARLVAGYAWKWNSKGVAGPDAPYDIELDGQRFRWNRADEDWIHSESSIEEVGSIHTVQGYDLNYAGVIIGPELRRDQASGKMTFHRESYWDRLGMVGLPDLEDGVTPDDAVLAYVQNIYRVLLTRGMRGTYIYVCDPVLREYFGSAIGGGVREER